MDPGANGAKVALVLAPVAGGSPFRPETAWIPGRNHVSDLGRCIFPATFRTVPKDPPISEKSSAPSLIKFRLKGSVINGSLITKRPICAN